MDFRRQIFSDIKEALLVEGSPIKHVDLWNENVTFLTQEVPFLMPAVFVEFDSVEWLPSKSFGEASDIKYRGQGSIRIHIVTDWTLGDGCFDLSSSVEALISGIDEISILSTTETNHNHEEIVENIDTYSIRVAR